MKVRIAEVFDSISGEVGLFPQGSPTTFIRFAGCSLGCPFCDTAKFTNPESGIDVYVDELVDQVQRFEWKQVLITGGEPLEQHGALANLVNKIKDLNDGYRVQVETNGAHQLLPPAVPVDCWVIDNKGQDCMGEVPYKFRPGNIFLYRNIWVKYLVKSLEDLYDTMGMITSLRPWDQMVRDTLHFAISAIHPMTPQDVVRAVFANRLPITVNVQLHKILSVR